MGFLKEFKEFAVKGNMIDLAVGMIIGSAFTSIVKSLVDDIFMPALGIFTGSIDFNNMFIALDGNTYATLAAAEEAGAAVIKYGSFITAVINFILMAIVVFIFVKQINKLRNLGKKEEAPAEPTEKECPYCFTKISIKACRCPNCTSELK